MVSPSSSPAQKYFSSFVRTLVRTLSSLKIAVIVIASLAILIAVGTFVEARYNSEIAQKLVYKTFWMYLVMGTLAVNLTAVMVSRWPWQKKHVPFILAHIGILVLLAGSLITYWWGLDGTLRIGIGEKNHFVTVPQTEVLVWSSFDGERYTQLFQREVDFFLDRPQNKSLEIPLPEGNLKITHFEPFTLVSRRIAASENQKMGSGLRFLVHNQRVNQSEWLLQKRPGENAQAALGLAKFNLGPPSAEILKKGSTENEIFIWPAPGDKFQYILYYRDPQRKPLKGFLTLGQGLKTGWMDLEFKVLMYFTHAEETQEFKPVDRPNPLTTSSIDFEFLGKKYSLQVNDVTKLFTDHAVYIFSYGQKRVDLDFDVVLKEFQMGRYQGTQRASSYQSQVIVPGLGEKTISMNEPLKHKGLTVYQASFQENEMGQPIASILSVNYDPGRWIKYLGSLILSLGVVWLFYNKRKESRNQAPKTEREVTDHE